MRRLVKASFHRQLLGQQFPWALVLQRPHRLVITPSQVLRQLLVEVLQTAERLPIIEISLVVPVAALYLPVVPGRSRRD